MLPNSDCIFSHALGIFPLLRYLVYWNESLQCIAPTSLIISTMMESSAGAYSFSCVSVYALFLVMRQIELLCWTNDILILGLNM